jgi:hypothetical protein
MAKAEDDYDNRDDTDWFRDELRQRDRRIAELRQELSELNDLVQRMREHAEDYVASIESWCDTFDMELTDDGKWVMAAVLGPAQRADRQVLRPREALE